jgi:hypothetical protein
MVLPSLRRLALADVDEEMLRRLVDHGEDLLVERKRQLPAPPKFGAAAASLANTLGGWILLGVADDRELIGFDKPENLDLQSHLAQVLRNEVDPLPPFVAEMFELDGKPIGLMRVFESADAPHIVRDTGAVYVRSSSGREPVDDHRTLLELARRGEEAEQAARDRLGARRPHTPEPSSYLVSVRATPLTVTPQLAERPISAHGSEWLEEMADLVARRTYGGAASEPAPGELSRRPLGRGCVATRRGTYAFGEGQWAVRVAADASGLLSVAIGRPPSDGLHRTFAEIHDFYLAPAIDVLAITFEEWESYGRVALEAWINLPGSFEWVEIPKKGSKLGTLRSLVGELTIPAEDDERSALASQWRRELARSLGVAEWELP